jgi:hypothetical protein
MENRHHVTNDQVSKLVHAMTRGDLYRLTRGAVLSAVIEMFPTVPAEVLDRITVTSDPTSADGFSTNAAFILKSWLDANAEPR